jgi:hypothetical protein
MFGTKMHQCQWGKVYKQPTAPLHAIPVSARRFSLVHVDLVGPLPASSDGHVCVPLTVIDRSTRWVEELGCATTQHGGQQVHAPLHRCLHCQLGGSVCTGKSRMPCVHVIVCDAGPVWHSHIPWVLMGLRAAPKEDLAVSSAELVNGSPLILPGRQLLHMPDPPHVDVPPPPTRPASWPAVANMPPAHLA